MQKGFESFFPNHNPRTFPPRIVICCTLSDLSYLGVFSTGFFFMWDSPAFLPYTMIWYMDFHPHQCFFYNFFCSCLVVFYLGIIFSICQILLASWIGHLGTLVEVSLIIHVVYVLSFELILIGKVEKPYNQLKEHLEACLTKYSDLDSAVGPFFLINFCFLQVSDQIIFEDCSMCTHLWSGQHDTLSLPLLDGTSSGSRDNSVLSNYYICLFIMFECENQVEHYGSETLMGIVSISLLILALSGPCHLFNSVSWVENLQSRLTQDPPNLSNISLKVP